MDVVQIATLVLVLLLGSSVLGSYVPIARDQMSGLHDYWLGIPSSVQKMFYASWGLAAAGFVTYIVSILASKTTPKAGLFSYGEWIRPLLIGLALALSALWSASVWATMHKGAWKGWASIAVVGVAACVVLLMAGEAEADAPWHRILGLMLFAVPTVLIDPVMWNAKWILG